MTFGARPDSAPGLLCGIYDADVNIVSEITIACLVAGFEAGQAGS